MTTTDDDCFIYSKIQNIFVNLNLNTCRNNNNKKKGEKWLRDKQETWIKINMNLQNLIMNLAKVNKKNVLPKNLKHALGNIKP